MRVGLTYDLRSDYLAAGYGLEETAEFDSAETIDALERAIARAGHEVERIGALPQLVRALAGGSRWDLVFNIAEGMHGFGREAQVPALLEGFGIPCTFSDSTVMSLALHKGMTKRVLRDGGVYTPDFVLVTRLRDVDHIALPYPLFAKPVAEGTSKGIDAASRIENADQLRAVCAHLLNRFEQPVLVETFLPGREFTVGILGTGQAAGAIGCMEILLLDGAEANVYSYANKAEYEDRVIYRLLDDAALRAEVQGVALDAWRVLGGRDAGRVDVRLDETGRPACIEVNPLPGLNPKDSDLPIMCRLAGIPYDDLVEDILVMASERVRLQPAARARSRPTFPS